VVVLGGGDTGADCVATAHRQAAEQVTQISIRRRPPDKRPPDNPWPKPLKTYRKTYAQEEGGTEQFNVETVAFLDENGDGHVDCLQAQQVEWTYDNAGRRLESKVVVPHLRILADVVLIAIGFAGPETDPFADCGVEIESDGTIRTDDKMMTRTAGLFAAGDANMGASLVVWAIGEGRDVARMIDFYLSGHSDLPPCSPD
jgi:glutamate synthase (NADPH/NADH) small chain